jgi:methionine biosynthesis protein MetW
MKSIRNFLYKLKQDLFSLNKYPNVNLGRDFDINYERYWKVRRGEKYVSVLSDWQMQRVKKISNFLKKNDIVVDLGGGDGEILKELERRVGIKPICVDFSDIVLDEAKKKGIETIKMDLSDMKSTITLPDCDYFIGFEILEHMVSPEEIIIKLKDKARKGMIFSFPNTGYYLYRLRLLLGRFPVQWISHPGEHTRFWTVTDVKWWVKNLGLSLDALVVYEGLPFLKNILPNIFGKGIIIKISQKI